MICQLLQSPAAQKGERDWIVIPATVNIRICFNQPFVPRSFMFHKKRNCLRENNFHCRERGKLISRNFRTRVVSNFDVWLAS